MNPKPSHFKLVDTKNDKIITDLQFHAIIDCINGAGSIAIAPLPDNMKVLWHTGLNAPDGSMIFDEDVVEAFVDGEKTTDVVTWIDSCWCFGGYDGTLLDYPILRVLGNYRELRWPKDRG